MSDAPLRLLDLPLDEARTALTGVLADLGEKPFRTGQVLANVYQRAHRTFEPMTDLSRGLRGTLESRVRIGLLELSHRAASKDGTVKYLWRLTDGHEIESVAMPGEDHLSLCISSQVGCALTCHFCATASLGLLRNLTQGEMVDQVLAMLADWNQPERSTSVVFMGMGEPGYNIEAVLAAVRALNAPEGVGIGARHITVSTSGVIPAIRRIAEEPIQMRLAVSLHSGDQSKRAALMNVAERFPLNDLLASCQMYHHATGRRVTLEVAVMPGINDNPEDAASLAEFANAVPSKINLIPFNPIEGFDAPPSTEREAARFRDEVARYFEGDIMVRKTRGRDSEAACGMLHRARATGVGE